MSRLLLALLVLAACGLGPPRLPAADWEALARDPDRPRRAAALLARRGAAHAPDALRAWIRDEAEGRRHLEIPPALRDAWGEICPAVPAGGVGPVASLLQVAASCPLPPGFAGEDAGGDLRAARGNPVLALHVHHWLVSEGIPTDTAAAVARALRGAPPVAGGLPVRLPRLAGGDPGGVARIVLAEDGLHDGESRVASRTVPAARWALPLGAGGTGWTVDAWRGLAREGSETPVVAADARISAEELARLAASLAPSGGPVDFLGLLGEAGGVGRIRLVVPGGSGADRLRATVYLTPFGADVWRDGAHVPPVPPCTPGGVTVCRAAATSEAVLVRLVAPSRVGIRASAEVTVQEIASAVSALAAGGAEPVLDLGDGPCGPAPTGMGCVSGGATPLGAEGDPDNPAHVGRISTFYMDVEPVRLRDWAACADAGFCPAVTGLPGDDPDPHVAGLNWEAANRYCTWAGKRLPTEWEWEKAALLAPDRWPGSEWTRSWKEPSQDACGPACEGPDPLGPCGGSEPCHASGLRILRGGTDARGTPVPTHRRTALSPWTRRASSLRCALSGAEGQDPPPWLGRGSASRTPVLARAPARQVVHPWPALPDPTPPTEAELGIVGSLAADVLEDKPVCGEEKVQSWNFPRGQGGRSDMDCRDPITYVETNEKRLTTFTPYVRNIGGVYVGVGADQNYDLLALARSRWAFLFDYDPNVVRLQRLLRALVLASDTPEAFVDRFTPAETDRTMDLLADALAGEPDAAAIQRFFLGYQARLADVYRESLRIRADEPRYGWLSHPEQYRYVRILHQQGRIVILPGDMLATTSMREIGRATRSLGMPVRVFYTSNAPTSWGGGITPEWRANVAALPFDDDSLVLAVWNHGAFGQVDYWHYNVQRALTYQARLRHPGYRFMWQLAWDRIPSGDPDLTLTGVAGG